MGDLSPLETLVHEYGALRVGCVAERLRRARLPAPAPALAAAALRMGGAVSPALVVAVAAALGRRVEWPAGPGRIDPARAVIWP